MTACDARDGETDPGDGAVLGQRPKGKLRAARVEPARPGQQGREQQPVNVK